MAKKKPFKGLGGKSLSDLRKSIGLDKDKSKASTTEKERDKNLPYDFQRDDIKRISDPKNPDLITAEGEAFTMDRRGFQDNFKAQQTPSTFVKDLKEAYGQSQQSMNASAVGAGAFGGSRQAIENVLGAERFL